ncbi:hypothetical protein [Pseudoduganella namucuonensis]|uniref:Uncharacterized protein n=1 Tax=Pseudoduganella namucuonensis TaxID=1035707 RepID=A0A1I7KQ37_9BURK|nr:hypothetical protein [Pseudoduganella namucuonensis]SFU99545.1 hypothetical protein SAMN05216552_1018124 [Pseudoduganella namucuonensis]
MIDADRDLGDFCPTEARYIVPDVYHPSHAPAELPAPAPKTEAGLRALAALRASVCVERREAERRAAAPAASWSALPELYRRMLVRAAGLPPEVVTAANRDLTERDKVMLRSAVSDMRAWLATLVTL